ncbi:MAG: oxidoreductase [Candidatus Latescibacteria bacterium]|nr:oxidoreductase [Candidatus Latescibacterota bacterium]NIO29021.1 oxidoreductase [Candidatus Latescibacterota bacterium]NIO56646.1 oxidoreductase [Candidatus Latescibacterota bacterium]NIT02229.1 oxidoreductase [Candidatus Latescibacterota bacterium]NIT39114.1 oxidoreductase [Candidatus Latescibacterota bacterium]
MKKQRKDESRRDFLKKSVNGLAGLAVLPTVLGTESQAEPQGEKKKSKFITRKLGKTGLELPVVSMGVMNSNSPNLVRDALDAGIVLLDTAHGYQRGRNEEMIGEVVKDRPRDSYMIATKVEGTPLDRKTGLFTKEAKAGPFLEKFKTSLQRLGMDYVEILYLHSVVKREAVLYDEYMNAMLKLKKEGSVRFIGVSTHSNEPEVIRAAVDSKVYDVVLTAYNFRQPHLAELEKEIARAVKAGLGIVAMKTQAGVYWDRERQHQINMKAALKWALQNKNIHTAIPGFTTFDQLQEDISVLEDLTLTPQEQEDLELGRKYGMKGLYCRQCGTCLAQCDKDIDVPTMMRSYMYAYGYRNLAAAKETLSAVDLSNVPCSHCSACKVDCAMGFDVKERIEDIARLKSVPDDFVV